MEIRLLRAEDAPVFLALVEANRMRLREWLHWVDDHRSAADTERYIEHFRRLHELREAFHLGVFEAGTMCGMVSLHQIDWPNRRAALGYWVGAQWEGRGLMSRVCATTLDFAFDELKLNRIEAHCATGNHRSKRIPQRFGFRLEGVMREAEFLHQRWVDHELHALLASEQWKPEAGLPDV